MSHNTIQQAVLRPLPKATLHVKVQTLIFDTPPMVLLDFSYPEVSWEAHFRFKIGVLTQHVIQVPHDASCNPLWCKKMSKIGSQLGPQHGGNELTFSPLKPSWLHLGAILPPKCPQDPPRGHLGAILGPSWCHFGAILASKMCHLGPFNHLVHQWVNGSLGPAQWRLVGAAGG